MNLQAFLLQQWGKAIRWDRAQLMKTMSDPQFTGRLTGIIKKSIWKINQARGVRGILITAVPQHLSWMNFNRNNNGR